MTTPSPLRRRPPGRYDPPSLLAARSTAVLLSVLLAALIIAVAALLLDRFRGDAVQARVIDFQVLSDSAVRIDLEVVKPRGSAAYCIVRSRGRDGAEVGRDVAVVDATGSDERVVRTEVELATSARPVTGEVARCSPDPIRKPSPAPSPAP